MFSLFLTILFKLKMITLKSKDQIQTQDTLEKAKVTIFIFTQKLLQ